ncbi:kinetochore-associated Ndc80 complex subunit spc25 [Coemansia guatemalensis]|uniref:Kinetochore protein SPC25 n=1 Tax=Coemansia guatemalensis TaxID=2761395 RepID=A0A9W8LU82_9FUNG|nr:kinetochore-associated Ndc80 complex subunit spc25 [Coemansia guatemalensis]
MNTPARLPGFSTPRRRPLTPGRRDYELPSFNSPASIKMGRMLESAYSNAGNGSLDDELPGDVVEGMTAAAVTSTTEEYDPPRVWFQREEDRQQNEEFMRRVDEMVHELKRLIRDRKNEHTSQMAEWAERQSRMSADMSALEKENSSILSALKEEHSEENNLSNAVASLQIKQKQSEQSADKLAEKKRALEVELARRQNAIAEKRQVLDAQKTKNAPEIEFFQNQMGISISSERKDMLTFAFTQISLSDPSRPFSISVDLSRREYSVTKCTPALANLQTHVDWLNMSRDFFGFLKRIRREFAEHYLISTI